MEGLFDGGTLTGLLDWIRARPTLMVSGLVWMTAATVICVLFGWARRVDRREPGGDRVSMDPDHLAEVRLENARRRERLARLADGRSGDLPADSRGEVWRRLSSGVHVPVNEAAREGQRQRGAGGRSQQGQGPGADAGRQALGRQRRHDEEGR